MTHNPSTENATRPTDAAPQPSTATPATAPSQEGVGPGDVAAAAPRYIGGFCRDREKCLAQKAMLAELSWSEVPDDEALGAFLTGMPGKTIYAVDERESQGKPGVRFKVWKLNLPPLP